MNAPASDTEHGLVTIAEFNTVSEALAAQGYLEQNGIRVFLADYHGNSSFGAMLRVGIPVHVRGVDAQSAVELLENAELNRPVDETVPDQTNLDRPRQWYKSGGFKAVCLFLVIWIVILRLGEFPIPIW